MSVKRKIKVLVVDDSAVVRKLISEALNRDPEIEVVGTATDPYVARDKIVALEPDVLTLDIEMPRMDGLTFLKVLMKHYPLPIILISSLTQEGSDYAMKALQYGAVEVLAKPSGSFSVGDLGDQIVEKVKAAAASKIKKHDNDSFEEKKSQTILPAPNYSLAPRHVILMGASTGGTEALKDVLMALPKKMPGICVVQHIPAYFSKAFADRLNQLCELEVREAKEGDLVKEGLVLIAPGDYHMLLKWSGSNYYVSLRQTPKVWHQRPAVDILFSSAAECVQSENTIAAILTGMGKDGAEGMLKLKNMGVKTYAQNEESCVVFGMPRAAIEMKAVDHVVHLQDFARMLVAGVAKMSSSA